MLIVVQVILETPSLAGQSLHQYSPRPALLLMKKSLDALFFNHSLARENLRLFIQNKESKINYSFRGSKEESSLLAGDLARDSNKFIKLAFKDIKAGRYVPVPAHEKTIHADKPRLAYTFSVADEFLMFHLARCLESATCSLLPTCLYSFRQGYSSRRAVQDLKKFMLASASKEHFVLRRDIRTYGESLNHQEILKTLKDLTIVGTELCELLTKFCRFKIQHEDLQVENFCGLPTGTYLQIVFENLFLLDMDRELSAINPGGYFRFGDDLLFISKEEGLCQQASEIIERQMKSKKLQINEEKKKNLALWPSHKIPAASGAFYQPQAYVEFLGVRIWNNAALTLVARKERAVRKFMSQRIQAICNNINSTTLSATDRTRIIARNTGVLLQDQIFLKSNPLINYIYYIDDKTYLKKLDNWLALEIIRQGFNRKAPRPGYFKYFSLKQIRLAGLPALVHLKAKALL